MTNQEREAWRRALIPPAATLRDAIKNLDQTALQIILVADQDGALMGTITDGDIRRALLRGLGMATPVTDIMNPNPLVVPIGVNREAVLQMMQINKLHQLPVVDERRVVSGLYHWDDFFSQASRSNIVLIMAGGLGKRLRPYTEDCPKPMLSVGGRPIIEHIIDRAKAQGFNNFVIAIRYLGQMIKDHFGDGSSRGIRVEYVQEDEPLGTAGALGLIKELPENSLVVSNGDVLTDINYGDLLDFHERYNADATMAVRMYEWQHPFGVVHTEGINIVGIEEKPTYQTHVNAGIYALSPRALVHIKKGQPCDMPEFFELLQTVNHKTIAYPMHEPWMDIGRPDDLKFARQEESERQKKNAE